MQYKKNGQVNCNAVDLAVLHREAQKGKAWATPEAFLNAPHREIPYIPSVQIFVLLAIHIVVDAMKARYKKINYITDQVIHYVTLLIFLV